MRSVVARAVLIAFLLVPAGCLNVLTVESLRFDDPQLNDNVGSIRSGAQEADLIFVGTITELGPPPPAWSGLATFTQAVTYDVERVLKGTYGQPTIVVNHLVVARSRHAAPTVGLSAQIFRVGTRLIVFAKLVDLVAFRDADEDFGTLPFSAKNELALHLLL